MFEMLRRRVRTKSLAVDEATVISLLVAAADVRDRFDQAYRQFGLTAGQYNVLRILNRAPPGGYSRREIVERMIERAPDVTRLVDRLEARGLVERTRSEATDRRLSHTRITPDGAALVERVRPAVDRANREVARRLGRADCLELIRICEQIYGPEVA
jgi:DNA-binding MarR family transcriptional regulator